MLSHGWERFARWVQLRPGVEAMARSRSFERAQRSVAASRIALRMRDVFHLADAMTLLLSRKYACEMGAKYGRASASVQQRQHEQQQQAQEQEQQQESHHLTSRSCGPMRVFKVSCSSWTCCE